MSADDHQADFEPTPTISSRFQSWKPHAGTPPKLVFLCGAVTFFALICTICLLKPPTRQFETNLQTPDTPSINQQLAPIDNYAPRTLNPARRRTGNRSRPLILLGLERIDRRTSVIPPGTMIRANLITGASNGLVRAETKEAFCLHGETLIPEKTTLLGSGQSTEERLIIRFTQVVYQDGSFANVTAQALDSDDLIVGLKGTFVGKYGQKYAAAVGLNLVGGMTDTFQERQAVGQQAVSRPNARNALLSGASRAALEMANETMTGVKNRVPIIQVKAGREIMILFDQMESRQNQ